MSVVIGMVYVWINEVSYQQLLMKVNTDIYVAHEAFADTQNKYLIELALLAESYPFRDPMERSLTKEQESVEIKPLMANLKKEKGFDFLQLITINGCDYWQANNCNIKKSPLMTKALSGEPAAGIEIFSSQELQAINPDLAEKVYLPLIQTLRAHPSKNTVEDRGMVLHSYYPIRDTDSTVKAILIGGVLLNRNFKFVDTLRDLVYSKGSLAEDGLGTVTIFLEDVRISTNVPGQLQMPKQRAIGTRVSEKVREQVLSQGLKWTDRAFVVSEWYISAYEPIIDVFGQRVGMLYTGFLEAPFRATYFTGMTLLLLFFSIVVLISILLAVFGAKSIYKPIEAMAKVINTVEHGGEIRIGQLESKDEVAMLAQQFNGMLDTLQEQREQIQNSANVLEAKVEDRTRQLRNQKINLQRNLSLLKQTREKLVAKEKLAAIGELTAGIAHEVNNPTAVILGNMDLLVEELGENAKPVEQQTKLIIQQVYRIRAITDNLLQYSRPEDYQVASAVVNINEVINDTLALVQHDLKQQKIELNLDLRSTVSVSGNHQQFQQVLINLLVNAMNAQETAGMITVRTRNWRDQGVLMVVRDNGRGISAEALPRIFDPFYTQTKSGTGLGLYVSSGILNRYGAEILVRSRVGVGSCFFVWFYCDSVQQRDNSIKTDKEVY
ncbi:MAG: cache domain-containing protein [Piscirickettsiaceae bacterium]|nr:cache domain-containing protein [Piscirickettsiaceae bacterium]